MPVRVPPSNKPVHLSQGWESHNLRIAIAIFAEVTGICLQGFPCVWNFTQNLESVTGCITIGMPAFRKMKLQGLFLGYTFWQSAENSWKNLQNVGELNSCMAYWSGIPFCKPSVSLLVMSLLLHMKNPSFCKHIEQGYACIWIFRIEQMMFWLLVFSLWDWRYELQIAHDQSC